jgi:hypothetical protein
MKPVGKKEFMPQVAMQNMKSIAHVIVLRPAIARTTD